MSQTVERRLYTAKQLGAEAGDRLMTTLNRVPPDEVLADFWRGPEITDYQVLLVSNGGIVVKPITEDIYSEVPDLCFRNDEPFWTGMIRPKAK